MDYYNEDYLMHFGVKGMKWGVRRTAEQLGHKIRASRERRHDLKDRRKELSRDLKTTKTGNKITDKKGEVLTRKQFKGDDPTERKKRIDADIKEADDRVKFYGSKRAAKAAINDEAEFAKSVNRGEAVTKTILYGGSTGLAGFTLAGVAGTSVGAAAAIGAAPIVGVGLVSAVAAKKANDYIKRHAKDQLLYTDDSEYGHDFVIAFKKHD